MLASTRLLALLAVSLLAACTTTQSDTSEAKPDPKRGLEGTLVFQADHCFMEGCALGPVMVGMRSKAGLRRVDREPVAAGLRAESSSPAIVAAEVVGSGTVNGVQTYDLELTPAGAGSAEIRFVDAEGALVDRLLVEAREAAVFKFVQLVRVDRPRTETQAGCTGCVEEQIVDGLTVEVGKASETVYAQGFDQAGNRLEAYGDFEFDVEDRKVARPDCLVGVCVTFGQDNTTVRGVASGTTRLLVRAGGKEGSLPVTVR